MARHVAEEAVEHVRTRELGLAPMQRENVGDHLPLHFPDEIEVGDHREHADGARRQREGTGKERRLARRCAREFFRRMRRIVNASGAWRRHVGDHPLDHALDGARGFGIRRDRQEGAGDEGGLAC
jgi:hypothetical protein